MTILQYSSVYSSPFLRTASEGLPSEENEYNILRSNFDKSAKQLIKADSVIDIVLELPVPVPKREPAIVITEEWIMVKYSIRTIEFLPI